MTSTRVIVAQPAMPQPAMPQPAVPQTGVPQLVKRQAVVPQLVKHQHPVKPAPPAPLFSTARAFWLQNREASLSWLAFGMLLAAWNAAGDDAAHARARPDALRGYSSVSVRAAQRAIVAPE